MNITHILIGWKIHFFNICANKCSSSGVGSNNTLFTAELIDLTNILGIILSDRIHAACSLACHHQPVVVFFSYQISTTQLPPSTNSFFSHEAAKPHKLMCMHISLQKFDTDYFF
jgi:hypothetical protein